MCLPRWIIEFGKHQYEPGSSTQVAEPPLRAIGFHVMPTGAANVERGTPVELKVTLSVLANVSGKGRGG
jgi:hypothetical protein